MWGIQNLFSGDWRSWGLTSLSLELEGQILTSPGKEMCFSDQLKHFPSANVNVSFWFALRKIITVSITQENIQRQTDFFKGKAGIVPHQNHLRGGRKSPKALLLEQPPLQSHCSSDRGTTLPLSTGHLQLCQGLPWPQLMHYRSPWRAVPFHQTGYKGPLRHREAQQNMLPAEAEIERGNCQEEPLNREDETWLHWECSSALCY